MITRLFCYNPNTGRFVTVDPLMDMGDPQSWNGYTYADNNPATHSDPSGLLIPGSNGGCHTQKCTDDHNRKAEDANNGGCGYNCGGSGGEGGGGSGGSTPYVPPIQRIQKVAAQTIWDGAKGLAGTARDFVGCIGKMSFLESCEDVAQAVNPINIVRETVDPIIDDVRNGRPLDAIGRIAGMATAAAITRGVGGSGAIGKIKSSAQTLISCDRGASLGLSGR